MDSLQEYGASLLLHIWPIITGVSLVALATAYRKSRLKLLEWFPRLTPWLPHFTRLELALGVGLFLSIMAGFLVWQDATAKLRTETNTLKIALLAEKSAHAKLIRETARPQISYAFSRVYAEGIGRMVQVVFANTGEVASHEVKPSLTIFINGKGIRTPALRSTIRLNAKSERELREELSMAAYQSVIAGNSSLEILLEIDYRGAEEEMYHYKYRGKFNAKRNAFSNEGESESSS